jgi:response regulator RpfG family c-di-GMP phosphodiesterase
MSQKTSLLLIDDDNQILMTLSKIIEKNFPDLKLMTASNGIEGWDIIQKAHPSIVICDISLPTMDGLQILIKIRSREELNDMYFIILTADTDRNRRIKALEKGADDFIVKPVTSDEITARINSAMRTVVLQNQMREENRLLMELADELERDIEDMAMLAVKFMQARVPSSFEMLKKISAASTWIGKKMRDFDNEYLRDIEIAGLLCEAGRVFLPDELLKKPVMEGGKATHELMYQVPVSSRNIVGSVRRFKDVADLLYHIYENFDGSGFPERLKSWQIPIGSRIIRVAHDFYEFKDLTDMSSMEILNKMHALEKRLYDYKAMALLDQFVRSQEKDAINPNEKAIQLNAMQEGMILARDIFTYSGLKLIPAGAVLKDATIRKLIAHNTSDPIIGNIYVKK